MARDLRDLYSKIKSAQELQAIFDKMGAEEKTATLSTPLSAGREANTLSFMVRDGYFSEMGYGRDEAEKPKLVTVVLNEMEKSIPDPAMRAAVLMSSNGLGQTVFHKALQYGDGTNIFNQLAGKLNAWAPPEASFAFMKNLLSQPLGAIDHDISYALQDVRDVRPWGSPEAAKIQALCTDRYKPATFDALKSAVDEVRPLIIEWLDKHAAAPKKQDYQRKKEEGLRAFAQSPSAVSAEGTLMTQAFPGPDFTRLLEIERNFHANNAPFAWMETGRHEQADRIFAMLSQSNKEGNTPMHRRWQHSTLLGPPPGPGCVEDRLGALIASFDKMLGTDVTIDLTKKLLLQENAKGELPLDNYEYNDMPRRNYYIEAFLRDLRKELGDREKFKTYLKEVVAAVLPADFTIKPDKYEPVEVNEKTGEPKPKRGARLDF